MQTDIVPAGIDVEVYDAFDAIPDSIRKALSPAQVPFLESIDWFRCLASTLPAHHALRIYTASDPKRSDVLALYAHHASGSRQLSGLVNCYSVGSCITTTATGSARASLLRALLERLTAERPYWHSFEIRLLDRHGDLYQTCVETLPALRFVPEPFFQYRNWYLVRSARTFEEYWAQRPGTLRNTVRRKSRLLARDHGTRLSVATNPGPELEKTLDEFTDIYSASWKGPEPQPAFIPQLVRTAAKAGCLWLAVMYIDQTPAAAQIWIVSHGKATIYKLAYRPEFASFSAGTLLSASLFRRAFDLSNVIEIDYGVGDEIYKREWMESGRICTGLLARNTRTALGLMGAFRAGLLKAVKHRPCADEPEPLHRPAPTPSP